MTSIEREITVAAPPGRVWTLLTDPDHLGAWFADGHPATVDLRPGGLIVFQHGPHGQLPATIQRVEPPRLLSYRWTFEGRPGVAPTPENSTLVEFVLTPVGTNTLVQVVETGFDDLRADAVAIRQRFDANAAGWGGRLDALAAYGLVAA